MSKKKSTPRKASRKPAPALRGRLTRRQAPEPVAPPPPAEEDRVKARPEDEEPPVDEAADEDEEEAEDDEEAAPAADATRVAAEEDDTSADDTLGVYLRQMGAIPLLNREQELVMAMAL